MTTPTAPLQFILLRLQNNIARLEGLGETAEMIESDGTKTRDMLVARDKADEERRRERVMRSIQAIGSRNVCGGRARAPADRAAGRSSMELRRRAGKA